jgi:hypothetical protein
MNARDADTVTRLGPPDYVDAGPVAGRRPLPTDPWLRMDGHAAVSAVIIRIWTTGRSRPGFS